jgi:signal transduction histidine kinase
MSAPVAAEERQREVEGDSRSSRARQVATIVALAVAYTLLGRIGLVFDPVGGFATAVWGPTGLSIAMVLLRGPAMGIGVWIGALATNLMAGASVSLAATFATGNTAEALAAAMILTRRGNFNTSLTRLTDVLWFALVAGVLAPAISASVGATAMGYVGRLTQAELPMAWRTWWVGDCIGALIVAPVILTWGSHGVRGVRRRAAEAGVKTLALVIVSLMVFTADPPTGTGFLQAYLLFPVLIWGAMRFGPRGASMAVLLTSLIAIMGTVRGDGPFAGPDLRSSLFELQTFVGIIAVSMLALAAANHERVEAARHAKELLASIDSANRSKSDFLAAMSHELRTPLNAIAGYAQLLQMDIHGQLTPKQRDAVERIDSNQRHLATLVADVLSFTRMEAGRLTLQLGSVSLARELESLHEYVGHEAERRGIALDVSCRDGSLVVQADVERLRQVLLNLVMNAIKFSTDGGRVTVGAARDGDRVLVRVRDDGIGIAATNIERVFEPFYQVERGHARRYPGVGLGLTIARDLARAMGGDIVLQSAPGKGTTALLTLKPA